MSGYLQGLVWLARLPAPLNAPSAKAILARVADAADVDGQGCRPLARAWIAEDVGLSEAAAKRWIRRLKEEGLVKVACGGNGRGNAPTYNVNVEKIADYIPEDRMPADLRNPKPDEKKGIAGDPLSSKKRGSPRSIKGVTGNQKRGHQRPPLQGLSTKTSTEGDCAHENNSSLEEIIAVWEAATGLTVTAKSHREKLYSSIQRNGADRVLKAIEARQNSRFLRGETGKWAPRGMPLSWLCDDDRLERVLSGEFNDRPTPKSPNSSGRGDGLFERVRRRHSPDRSIFDGFEEETSTDATQRSPTIELAKSSDGSWR